MTTTDPNLSDLSEENRLLREVIGAAMPLLDTAATRLDEVLADEVLITDTPLEVEAAMRSAAETIQAAARGLRIPVASTKRKRVRRAQVNSQADASRSSAAVASPPGGPTRQQAQFLAYIREYMLLNRGVAPAHVDFQKFFNLTPPTVNSMLKRLDEKGFIRRIPGKARAIELTIDPDLLPPLDRPF